MSHPSPPALAIRLMNETMTDPAVIGDLVEEHARGRGAWWFWKQAIVASAPSPMNALRWVVAIPLAYKCAGLVGRAVNSTGWEAAALLSGPLAAASLIVSAAWIVPTRKALVAKTLFVLVAGLCAVFIAYSTYRSNAGPGDQMAGVLRNIAAAILLGAGSGYAVVSYFLRPRIDRGRLTMDH